MSGFIFYGIIMAIVFIISVSVRQKQLKQAQEAERAKKAQQAARRAETGGTPSGAPAAPPTVRKPLERPTMRKTIPEKPVAAHTDTDCGGGSIHDGYHEGVTQFDKNRPAAVAGRLGHRLADEDDRLVREKIAADNAKRAMARIAKLPPLAQGMVYSEILGKPKSAEG